MVACSAFVAPSIVAREPGLAIPAPIAGMVACSAFVAPSIVARESGHEFLIVTRLDIVEELGSLAAAQRRCMPSAVRDHHITVLPRGPFETIRACHGIKSARLLTPATPRKQRPGEWWR